MSEANDHTPGEGSGGISRRAREHRFPPALVTKTITFLITPLYRNQPFLHEQYVEKGLSIAEISAQIFSSKEAVRRGLISAGIEVREPHVPHHGRQSQPRFGQRRVKGHTTEFKREQHVVEAIREMRANGLTLRQIASTLTTMKVPTKLDGKRWHPEMVSRILQGKREDGRIREDVWSDNNND